MCLCIALHWCTSTHKRKVPHRQSRRPTVGLPIGSVSLHRADVPLGQRIFGHQATNFVVTGRRSTPGTVRLHVRVSNEHTFVCSDWKIRRPNWRLLYNSSNKSDNTNNNNNAVTKLCLIYKLFEKNAEDSWKKSFTFLIIRAQFDFKKL